MKNTIKNEIINYVLESKDNWFSEINDHYFDEPLIRFAAPEDPLFYDYKDIIGESHFTPKEAFELAFGKGSFRRGTVISVVFPINEKTMASNRLEKEFGSKEWALTRYYGDEVFLGGFASYFEALLIQRGYRTIAPAKSEWFKVSRSQVGPFSNWSERHIAYAAGHGTFSINDGFITEKGITIKLVSFVTELELEPDIRKAKSHTENCLFCNDGICGACIKRCPVGAISENGHDKIKCYNHVYGEGSKSIAVTYGGNEKVGSGCGLCQTKVPCEGRNPRRTT